MKKILILAANPKQTDKLRLDEEVREIEEGLKRSRDRNSFEIISCWAVRPSDLRRALLDHEPHIVHFSGHGVGSKGLLLEDKQGKPKPVSGDSLAELFELFEKQVECVLLNACYSQVQANAIHQHINCVIGMNQAIGDRAAIEFVVGFYDGLGAGRSYADAFKFGRLAIDLEGIPKAATPVLLSRGNGGDGGNEADVAGSKPSSASPSSSPQNPTPHTPHPAQKIFLSYKRNIEPDEPVARALFEALQPEHRVFIDQTMLVGTQWAERIEAEIRQTDVLIVLLTEASVRSEMVEAELTLAHQLKQELGRPLIFPVRLAYTAPFRYPLNQYLDPLQWAFWQSEADTPSLIEQLTSALAGKPLPIDSAADKQQILQLPTPSQLTPPDPMAQPAVATSLCLEPPEGSMAADSEFYIQRAEDAVALSALQRQGGTVTILGPRQMGKSSLLIRTMNQAREQKKHVAFLDFQRLETAALQQADLFYRRFCEWLTARLRLPSQVDRYWQNYQSLGNPLRCTYYLQEYLLEEQQQSIFLAMDEVDKLIAAPFRDEFFSTLRSWHNERAFDPIWKQLDLVMVTCTEPYQLIQDLNQSPFNVGKSITLKDFTAEEVAELNRRHNNALNPQELQSLMEWMGGHPYLVRKALYLVASGEMSAAEVFASATAERGPFGDHLRYHLFRMDDKAPLVRGLLQAIHKQASSDEQVLRRLEGAGLVKRQGRQVQPRCRLYAEYFKEHLRE